MTMFLVNPKRKGKRRMAKKKKSKATPAQRRALKKARAALARKKAARKRAGRKAAAARKKKSTKRATARKNPTKRRRKSTVAKRRTKARRRRNPRRRPIKGVRQIRRKVYTRNPPVTLKNMGQILRQGLIDSSGVVAGKVGARFVAGFIPSFGEGPIMNFAKQGVAALAVGFVGGQVLPREYARFMIAGALAAPMETFLQGLPVVGDLVSGNAELGEAMGYGLPMGEGPDWGLPMGEYVQPQMSPNGNMGEYVEMYP